MSDSNLPRIAFVNQYPTVFNKIKSPYRSETDITQWNDTSILNRAGGNRGNLVWMESVYRIFKYDLNNSCAIGINRLVKDYKTIDENFDFVIINMACWITNVSEGLHLLPPNYFSELKFKKCKVICLGNGGVRKTYIKSNPNLSKDNFCTAIIELLRWMADNADILSVRGEETKRTLKEVFNIDSIALGCPSLYSFPNSIDNISLPPVEDSILASGSNLVKGSYHKYFKSFRVFKSVNYFCQSHYEFDAPSNIEFPRQAKPSDLVNIKINEADGSVLNYPFEIDGIDKMYAPNNVDTWRGVLSMHDYYIGSRLHGALLALQAGIFPAVFSNDERLLEVARLVGMPHLNLDTESFDIKNLFTEDSLKDFKKKYRMRHNLFYKALSSVGLVL